MATRVRCPDAEIVLSVISKRMRHGTAKDMWAMRATVAGANIAAGFKGMGVAVEAAAVEATAIRPGCVDPSAEPGFQVPQKVAVTRSSGVAGTV
jgi:hypothetical protein